MKHFSFSLIAFCLVAACTNKQEMVRPEIESISESVYASGIVKSKYQYEVFSTTNGLIQKILVTEGDLVKKGTPIIWLLNEASLLNTENARLAADFSAVSANHDKLDELKANIELARVKMMNDSLLLARQRSLWSNQIGTLVELEQRELAYSNSSTIYKTTVFRYSELEKELNFAAQQSTKNFQITKAIRNDYIIKSEIDGKVYSLLKEKGELVSPQSPIAVIGDANKFIIELQVDEYDIAKIKPGQKVFVSMDSYKGKVFEAKVNKIYPMMNERSRSFKVDADFVTQPPTLYPSLTAETNVLIRIKEKALTIPKNYLLDNVFVLMKNNERRRVTVGLQNYEKVEILSGLTVDDIIINPIQ
ncbi:MAG TPA: efflux RND transporter periplasmic adaptor subunit [Cytophagaceae bacterium]|nr:efflux RND transporter periplasmic adaptor subunit [Cytophagaceae bacterium]